MHAASRHGAPGLTALPKDGGVSCFGRSSEGRPSSTQPCLTAAKGTGWAAWLLTPQWINGGARWGTSYRCCIVKQVKRKEVTPRGRLDCFLDSAMDHVDLRIRGQWISVFL